MPDFEQVQAGAVEPWQALLHHGFAEDVDCLRMHAFYLRGDIVRSRNTHQAVEWARSFLHSPASRQHSPNGVSITSWLSKKPELHLILFGWQNSISPLQERTECWIDIPSAIAFLHAILDPKNYPLRQRAAEAIWQGTKHLKFGTELHFDLSPQGFEKDVMQLVRGLVRMLGEILAKARAKGKARRRGVLQKGDVVKIPLRRQEPKLLFSRPSFDAMWDQAVVSDSRNAAEALAHFHPDFPLKGKGTVEGKMKLKTRKKRAAFEGGDDGPVPLSPPDINSMGVANLNGFYRGQFMVNAGEAPAVQKYSSETRQRPTGAVSFQQQQRLTPQDDGLHSPQLAPSPAPVPPGSPQSSLQFISRSRDRQAARRDINTQPPSTREVSPQGQSRNLKKASSSPKVAHLTHTRRGSDNSPVGDSPHLLAGSTSKVAPTETLASSRKRGTFASRSMRKKMSRAVLGISGLPQTSCNVAAPQLKPPPAPGAATRVPPSPSMPPPVQPPTSLAACPVAGAPGQRCPPQTSAPPPPLPPSLPSLSRVSLPGSDGNPPKCNLSEPEIPDAFGEAKEFQVAGFRSIRPTMPVRPAEALDWSSLTFYPYSDLPTKTTTATDQDEDKYMTGTIGVSTLDDDSFTHPHLDTSLPLPPSVSPPSHDLIYNPLATQDLACPMIKVVGGSRNTYSNLGTSTAPPAPIDRPAPPQSLSTPLPSSSLLTSQSVDTLSPPRSLPTTTSLLANSSYAPKSSSTQPSSRKQSSSRGKRRRVDDNEDEDPDSHDENKNKGEKEIMQPKRRLACPFFKRSPQKYESISSCTGPGWWSVHRIKEHIYRHHLLPLHCSRCLDNFKSDALLSAHQRINPPCDVNSQSESPEGVSGSQISVLKARKKNPNVSETDKWKEMYRVIFPEDDEKDMPSPFYEHATQPIKGTPPPFQQQQGMESCFSHIQTHLPKRVRTRFETALASTPQFAGTAASTVDIEKLVSDSLNDILRSFLEGKGASALSFSSSSIRDGGTNALAPPPRTSISPSQHFPSADTGHSNMLTSLPDTYANVFLQQALSSSSSSSPSSSSSATAAWASATGHPSSSPESSLVGSEKLDCLPNSLWATSQQLGTFPEPALSNWDDMNMMNGDPAVTDSWISDPKWEAWPSLQLFDEVNVNAYQ